MYDVEQEISELMRERDREAARIARAATAGERCRQSVTAALVKLCEAEPSKSEFARKCNTTPQNVQNWITGASVPPLDKVAEIAEVYGLPIAALTGTAEGEPMLLVPEEEQLLKRYRALPSRTRRAVAEIVKALNA